MANLSWKSSTLLATVLVVALALQAGGVKILLNLHRPADTAAATTPARAPLDKPAPATVAHSDPPAVTDPPPPSEAALLTLAQQPPAVTTPEPPPAAATASSAASPEARLATTIAPAPHSAARPAVAPKNPPPPTATASVEAAPHSPASPASAPTVATAPIPAVTPSAEAATIKPDDAPSDGLRDAAWLKTRDPKNYTVQIYSGKDLNKLKEIAATTSSGPQAYFTTGNRTSPWYSLVVGDYPDSAAARAAAATIAAQSVQLKPWVRRIDEIQANMR